MTKAALSDADIFLEYGVHIPSQTILITGEIDLETYEHVMVGTTLINTRKAGTTHINIELNSPGGDWYAGIAIYDHIRACKFPVTIRVHGMAMSIASVILQAADERIVSPGATIMVHDGEEAVAGTPMDLQAWAKHNQALLEQMYRIYADASGKPPAFWRKHCKSDYILTAQEAVKLGLADKVAE